MAVVISRFFSSTGNDGVGDGSAINPWRTINKANTEMAAVDGTSQYIFTFQNGETFGGPKGLEIGVDGIDITQPLCIRGEDFLATGSSTQPIFDMTSAPNEPCIDITSGVDYVLFEHLGLIGRSGVEPIAIDAAGTAEIGSISFHGVGILSAPLADGIVSTASSYTADDCSITSIGGGAGHSCIAFGAGGGIATISAMTADVTDADDSCLLIAAGGTLEMITSTLSTTIGTIIGGASTGHDGTVINISDSSLTVSLSGKLFTIPGGTGSMTHLTRCEITVAAAGSTPITHSVWGECHIHETTIIWAKQNGRIVVQSGGHLDFLDCPSITVSAGVTGAVISVLDGAIDFEFTRNFVVAEAGFVGPLILLASNTDPRNDIHANVFYSVSGVSVNPWINILDNDYGADILNNTFVRPVKTGVSSAITIGARADADHETIVNGNIFFNTSLPVDPTDDWSHNENCQFGFQITQDFDDVSGLKVDPLFVDLDGLDFNLSNTSPCIGFAAVKPTFVDINEIVYRAGDLGAYAFRGSITVRGRGRDRRNI